MGADHSKLLEKQIAEKIELERKLAEATSRKFEQQHKAEIEERIRQEEREDKKFLQFLKEKRIQEDRDDAIRHLQKMERMAMADADEKKWLAEHEAKKHADQMRLQHESAENDKQRDLKKYEIDQDISLIQNSLYKKFQLQHELLQSCGDSPDFKDILKTSMDSMNYSFRRDKCQKMPNCCNESNAVQLHKTMNK